MRVKEAMSTKPTFLPPTSTVKEAAAKMQQLDCGFIPIGENDRLIGAVTDRDIVIRALAKGKEIGNIKLRDVMSDHILFVFEDDDLSKASDKMTQEQVHRLVVLDKNKRMTGIITSGDIARKSHDDMLCAKVVEGICEKKKEKKKH